MELVTSSSLIRGAAFIDFAFSNGGRALNPSVADTVGMVAAYVARGGRPSEIEKDLGERLAPCTAREIARAYDLFEDCFGRGLWEEGASMDDVKFTHPLLIQAYPDVNAGFERHMQVRSTLPAAF